MADLRIEAIVDENVLIRLLRGDRDLQGFLETLECGIDTTVYVEMIQGAKDKSEVARIEKAQDPPAYTF